MTTRRKSKDQRLLRIRMDLEKAAEAAERAWKRLRRSFGRFETLMCRVRTLERREGQRVQELAQQDAMLTGGVS